MLAWLRYSGWASPLIGGALGFLVAISGWPVWHWEWWAIMVPSMILYTVWRSRG